MAMGATMLRLQREIVELEKEQLEGIKYHISESTMKHMCLVLSPQSGPFRGLSLHLKVHIPDDYPREPPTVTIQTLVSHPNVFSESYICCDILHQRDKWSAPGYNGGYTPAYLLKYIFLQLLSFFSVDAVDQDYGDAKAVVDPRFFRGEGAFRKRAEAAVQNYQCQSCGFNVNVDTVCSSTSVDAQLPSVSTVDQCALGALGEDSWLLILDKLSDQDLNSLSRAWPPVKRLQQNVMIRRQLVCFYLRKTHQEDVLGIGLKVAGDTNHDHGPRSRRPASFVGRAASIKMLDLLSFEAFTEHGVRTGVYGEDIDVFLPIAISPSHFRAAESILKDSLMSLHRMRVRPEHVALWPLCIVEVLPRLMNHMVLDLVKDCDKGANNVYNMKKSSEKALQGYCLLRDLFQRLANRFPEVEREIRSRVRLFRESEEGRRKATTPDVGEFLTFLLVLEEDWETYCVNFIEELLARNVVWYLDGRKREKTSLAHLAHLEDDSYVSLQRLKETFEATKYSLRLMMFQVGALRLVSRGKFDSHYGYPSAEDSASMFQLAQEIYAVKDWDACLRICEYPVPESSNSGLFSWRPHVCKMLKRAVVHSQAAKYHVMPYSKNQLYYWRWRAEPQCPPPSWWDPKNVEKYALHRLRPGGLNFFPNNR